MHTAITAENHLGQSVGRRARLPFARAGIAAAKPIPGRSVLRPTANFREAGTGTPVLCLHSSGSSSGQWRALMASLSDRYRALAVDLYGYGKSPAWCGAGNMRLADEVELIEPVLPVARRFHLVGHSYGAHVALALALADPQRVASLTLYEPAAFHLLAPGAPARLEIETIRDDTIRLLDAGADEAAAARFVDYWAGQGAWQANAVPVRESIVSRIGKLRLEWGTVLESTYSSAQVRALTMPVQLLTGSRTTAAARGVVVALRRLLPEADFVEFEGLGHMGPVTHAEVVNRAIVAFIDRVHR